MSRIFIVGAGTVGTATGRALGHAGHRVTFVDIDPRRVAGLVNEGLDARGDLDLGGEPESFVFLCVPTRMVAGRHHLADVAAGAETIGRALGAADCSHTVVVRSTVPPGTTRDLVRPLIELHSGRREGAGFAIAASPHFDGRASALRSGRHAIETVRPPLTVIGADNERVAHAVRDLLAALVPPAGQVRLLDDPAAAEMVKCAHSLFNATKISFWNEMWRVCDRLGLDPDEVATTVATSAEGSLNPEYGIWGGAPYSGNQLPGDTRGFLGFAQELGLPMPLLSAVVGVNSGFEQRLTAELEALSMLSGRPQHTTPDSVVRADPDRSFPQDPQDRHSRHGSHGQPDQHGPQDQHDPQDRHDQQAIPVGDGRHDDSRPPVRAEEHVQVEEDRGFAAQARDLDVPQPVALEPEAVTDRSGPDLRIDPPATHPARRRMQRRPWIPRQLGR